MRTASIVFSCIVLAWAASSQAAEEKPAEVEITVPKGDQLAVQVPAKWKHKILQRNASLPPTVAIEDEAGTEFDLKITLIPFPDAKLATQEALDKLVKQTSLQYVAGSVEKEATLKPLKSKQGFGSYYLLTDASLADAKELQPGEFRYVTSGVFLIGKQFATFTLLTNSTATQDYEDALKLITEGITVR